MAFTRFHDDPCRITKQNQIMTEQGRYMLNAPGNGDKPCYMLDPQIIPQKWAGNLWTNCIDVQSTLLGLNQPLTRDCLGIGNYENKMEKANTRPIEYPVCDTLTTDQSRVTHPAYLYKDLEQVDWYFLPLDPQENVSMPFQNNISTRILEKDYFTRQPDCISFEFPPGSYPSQQQFGTYVGGPTVRASTNSCLKM